ncbi:hypothetical protein [Pseudomonas mangrovi]|jgi:hypothetical protein|uniref:Uncharacterized protein n=1 Tax=Pseudomonas mangrovi TaxID=2161748 RepID=A0A2T5P6J8_9PSED|nr:hypothetical protein [Pseudomonas mangrovi]PTU73370.1 hypothetical protein DBO85_13605 [Pseudomonas mangrovi]
MDQENPYATPKVELIESVSLRSLPGLSASHLRLLGWLMLVCLLGELISLALFALGDGYDRDELVVASDVVSSSIVLLGAYLLLRLRMLLVARFAAQGLDRPVVLSVILSVLAQAMLLALGDEWWSSGRWAVAMVLVLVLFGGATLWLGIALLRIPESYGLLRTLAWLHIVSGAMTISVILMVLAFLLLLVAQFVMLLIFFREAKETR